MSAPENTHKNRTGGAPIVSVIIPTYNTTAFIVEALESVFAQTYTDFEVIVINDVSPDTDELEQFLGPFRELILYLKQENQGLAGTRNVGIRRAQGEYVAFLDSDDCWLAGYLASHMKVLEENPEIDVIYCDAQHFGDSSLSGKTYRETCPSNGPVTLDTLLKEGCQLIVTRTVARKQIVMGAGLFDESFRRCEDYDLWLRILYIGGHISYHREVLGRYWSHAGSLSKDAAKMSQSLVAVYEKAERTMDLPERTREILKMQLTFARACFDLESGRQLLAAGEFGPARVSFAPAMAIFGPVTS